MFSTREGATKMSFAPSVRRSLFDCTYTRAHALRVRTNGFRRLIGDRVRRSNYRRPASIVQGYEKRKSLDLTPGR